jgi:hypothetical protein
LSTPLLVAAETLRDCGLYWLGGAASYTYTHRCVRSYQEGVGTPDYYSVCEWTQDNGRRWDFLTPLVSLVHHPARMDGE